MEKKSGKHWVQWAEKNAPNSNSLSTLSPSFKPLAVAFINSLTNSGARVRISATQRHPMRAYLFHWAWRISQSESPQNCKPLDAKSMDGVDIQWDHGTLEESINAAKEMVAGFGLATYPKSKVAPALLSNHIRGTAIDMTISWNQKIKVKKKDGKEVELEISSQFNPNTNKNLIEIGKSFGVIKHINDTPHWSINGR